MKDFNTDKTTHKKQNTTLDGEFKHRTSIGQNGEILYDCPIEIKDDEDLNNFGITWKDCRTLNFHGSESKTVYFYKTENRALAEYLWNYIDTQHSSRYRNSRCLIPGKRKAWIKCPDTNSCANCPRRNNRKPHVVSRDALIEDGYEPAIEESVEESVCAKMELTELKRRMDRVDVRLYQAISLKEQYGLSVKDIAGKMGISEPRVYQLLAQVKEIAAAYRMDNR